MIQLIAVDPQHLLTINNIQKRSYKLSYEKYGNLETSPFTRTLGEVEIAIRDKQHPYFFMVRNEMPVGYVRLGSDSTIRQIQILSLGLLPEFDEPEIRKEAVAAVETQYSNADSYLIETIYQEQGQLMAYQEAGYELLPEKKNLQAGMTLVSLEKTVNKPEPKAEPKKTAAAKKEPAKKSAPTPKKA